MCPQEARLVDKRFARIRPTHQLREPAIVYFQSVTDQDSALCLDGSVFYEGLRASSESIASGVFSCAGDVLSVFGEWHRL